MDRKRAQSGSKMNEECGEMPVNQQRTAVILRQFSPFQVEKRPLFPPLIAANASYLRSDRQLNTHFLSTICAPFPFRTAAARAQITQFLLHRCYLDATLLLSQASSESHSCDLLRPETSKKCRLQHPRRSGAKQRSGPAGAGGLLSTSPFRQLG